MSAVADTIVVGGGVIGAFCARDLARAGVRVTVLERGDDWGEGCSWGNAGLIVPSHARPIAAPEALRSGLGWMVRRDSPFGLRLRPSLSPWLARYVRASTRRRAAAGETLQRELASESLDLLAGDPDVDAGFRQDGCLSVFTHAGGPRQAEHEAASSTGRALGARVLSSEEAHALEPALSERVTAGVLYPREAHVDPVRLTRSVGDAARRAGAVLWTHVDVSAVRHDGGGVTLDTSVGSLSAGYAIVAAGAWSGVLARTAGVRVPLQGGKGYAVEFEPDAVPLRRPVYLHDERCVATPFGDRVRMTGGLLLDGLDERFDARRVAGIRRAAQRGFKGGAAEPRLSWRGLRPCTPDGLPVIGAAREARRVVIASGHGMLGVTLAPVTARMVSGIVAGEPAHRALGALSPERFA
jgi:D-amino-acid dehydrogenase